MSDEMTFTLHTPLTEEEWDMITDVDLDHTPEITFHTKHGKEVVFVKRKTGKWIPVTNGRGGHCCNRCNGYAPSYMNGDEHLSDYCPYCGSYNGG